MKEIFPRKRYLSFLEGFSFAPIIKVLTGLRRVGKSSLLQIYIQELKQKNALSEQDVLYINKENFTFDNIRNAQDLFQYFEKWYAQKPTRNKFIVAIDEVQEIFEWEKIINSLLAEYQGHIEIIITGSNASMLSGDLATLLSGRYVTLTVYPFDFTEYCAYRVLNKNKENFELYLRDGGMPGLFYLPQNREFTDIYLAGIYDTVLLKDIVENFSVRNVSFLEQLYRYIFANTGCIISAKKISDYLKSQKISHSIETVLQYLHYGQDAFLLHKVASCDPGSKKFFEIYQKYYVGDIGIRNALVGYNPIRDRGRVLENYVYIQLISRGWNVSVGRLKNGKEIDFIAEKQGIIKYFQVCYLLSDENVIEREYSALESVADSWEKYVLSLDDIEMGIRNGIFHKKVFEIEDIL